MHKILVIAVREYKAAVRTKSFLVSLLLMPLLMFGGAGLQIFLEKRADTDDKHFALIDRTPGQKITPWILAAAKRRNETKIFDPDTHHKVKPAFILEPVEPSPNDRKSIREQRLQLSDEVRADKYWGFVEIGADVLRGGPFTATKSDEGEKTAEEDGRYLRYQTNHPTYIDFPQWLQTELLLAIVGRQTGLSTDSLSLPAVLTLRREGLSQRDPGTGQISDPPLIHQIAQFLVPAALVGLMFMMIMLCSTPTMHGVVEEKMQRIAEVLLGSVSPFQLMLGKLVGLMGVSLTMATVYLGGSYWAAYHFGFTEFLTPRVLAWFVIFQALAVLMYGSLFLAIGAASSDTKETQTLVLPVILIACLPMFILRNALDDPNSALVVGASFFPPVTPMMMMARVAIPPGPVWWQPVLSVLLAVVVMLLCVYAAGRIFRVGILMQGKGAKIGQLIQWVIRG